MVDRMSKQDEGGAVEADESTVKLPEQIGLCPVHAPYFYMPDSKPGDRCPEDCDHELVVYVRGENGA